MRDSDKFRVNETQTKQIRITIADSQGHRWTLPVVDSMRSALDLITKKCQEGYMIVRVERNF